jgi:hypothetical protein
MFQYYSQNFLSLKLQAFCKPSLFAAASALMKYVQLVLLRTILLLLAVQAEINGR